jgi:hypothetical protein
VDKTQIAQLEDNIKKSHRDIKENVWRSYNTVALLGKNNEVRFSARRCISTEAGGDKKRIARAGPGRSNRLNPDFQEALTDFRSNRSTIAAATIHRSEAMLSDAGSDDYQGEVINFVKR